MYITETLDLGWSFTSHTKNTWEFEYMTDPEEQLHALNVLEDFLKTAAKPLYPYSVFIVNNAKVGDDEYSEGDFLNLYRTLLLTGNWTEELLGTLSQDITRTILIQRINKFADDLEAFGAVSKKEWYGEKTWHYLNNAIEVGDEVSGLYRDWWYPTYTGVWGYTHEQAMAELVRQRSICGPFGFIGGSYPGGYAGKVSPQDAGFDLSLYINEMTKRSKAEFAELWGEYPLVMKKYDIIWNVVKNRIGIEL